MCANSDSSLKGLCCDCENRHTCMYLRSSECGVWHCNEYAGFEVRCHVPAESSRPAARPDARDERPPGVSSVKLKGLCSNCDDRHTCMYPKPEYGVWHCEEYR